MKTVTKVPLITSVNVNSRKFLIWLPEGHLYYSGELEEIKMVSLRKQGKKSHVYTYMYVYNLRQKKALGTFRTTSYYQSKISIY